MHRPTHVSFIMLSRKVANGESTSSAHSVPVCHATWDCPDPDTFYDTLQHVMSRLEPTHRRPGALVTAAISSEATGISLLRVKNTFGYATDFLRRSIRDAAPQGIILETFPLDIFLPPTEIHITKNWTKGMKRYVDCKILINTYNPYAAKLFTQAKLHGKRARRHAQPTGTNANARHRGRTRKEYHVKQDGLNNEASDIRSQDFFSKLAVYNLLIHLIALKIHLFRNINHYRYRNTPTSAIASLCKQSNTFQIKHLNPYVAHQSLIPYFFVNSLSSPKRFYHTVTGTTSIRVYNSQQWFQSDSNISRKEKGTPTPPRVERLASTATTQIQVSTPNKTLPRIAIYNATKIIPGSKSMAKSGALQDDISHCGLSETTTSNIYTTEKGTPTPPRVERLASTTSSQPQVIISAKTLPRIVSYIITDDITGPNPMVKSRNNAREGGISMSGLSAKTIRKCSGSNVVVQQNRISAKSIQVCPTTGTIKLGKNLFLL